jgi:hypothetical protein
LNLQRSEARRKHWEEEAATMSVRGEAGPAFQELALPHIDGALAELGDTDRDAVILRFLQQKSFRDVALIFTAACHGPGQNLVDLSMPRPRLEHPRAGVQSCAPSSQVDQ